MGRRALGYDFGFMRRAAERGACAVGWGFWEPSGRELAGGDAGAGEG